uniref:WSC domain-containing protein n=1 Tax=Globodera pallida TaxID=36090 RepID=A0A183CDG4_GLOPA
MLGWWRLLLMYGIAINLGIDEPVSTASDVNGSKALHASDGNGSTASDVNGSNASGINGVTGGNRQKRDDDDVAERLVFPKGSDVNASNTSKMNDHNASDVNSSNASGVNGSNVSDLNASNALNVNGSNASDMNGSNASDMNGPNVSNVNASTAPNVHSSNATDGDVSTALGGNGFNALGLKGSTASNVKGSTSLDENDAIVENKNVVTKSGRLKRDDVGVHGLSTVVPVLFATALVKAVAMKSGKRVVNTSADHFLGCELSNYTFFARDAFKNCTAKCPCGWFNCVPRNNEPGDACCVANYTMSCGQPPKFSRGNPTECDQFRLAFYGQRHAYYDKKLVVQPSFFLENREGCPMCGWEVCIILSERLGCSCCAYENLAFCRWDLDGGCIYAPDDEKDKYSPRCPDCKWKMSISNDDSVVKCCDQSRLHQCTKVVVLPEDPLSDSNCEEMANQLKQLANHAVAHGEPTAGVEIEIPLQCVRHQRHTAGQRVLLQRCHGQLPLRSEMLPYDAEGPWKIVLIKVIRQE